MKQGRSFDPIGGCLVRIAAFDLDGTLTRGQTACEAIAEGIGHIGRMRELEQLESSQIEEIMAAREEMAGRKSLKRC